MLTKRIFCLQLTDPQFLTSSITNSCWFCPKLSDLSWKIQGKIVIFFPSLKHLVLIFSQKPIIDIKFQCSTILYLLVSAPTIVWNNLVICCPSSEPLLEITSPDSSRAGKPVLLTSLIRKLHVTPHTPLMLQKYFFFRENKNVDDVAQNRSDLRLISYFPILCFLLALPFFRLVCLCWKEYREGADRQREVTG